MAARTRRIDHSRQHAATNAFVRDYMKMYRCQWESNATAHTVVNRCFRLYARDAKAAHDTLRADALTVCIHHVEFFLPCMGALGCCALLCGAHGVGRVWSCILATLPYMLRCAFATSGNAFAGAAPLLLACFLLLCRVPPLRLALLLCRHASRYGMCASG